MVPISGASQIRPISLPADLLEIADLIEVCFNATMDEDGWEYLRHIRRSAKDPGLIRWYPAAGEMAAYPLHGYVWEENNHIIGNISLIPFEFNRGWRYLIANVAVSPEYRGRGIGHQLTRKGMEHIRNLGLGEAWLHVREDNPAALHIYDSLGFEERCRRETWQTPNSYVAILPAPDVNITRRIKEDWSKQNQWLLSTYPEDVAWHLSFNPERFKPSFWVNLLHFVEGHDMFHWVARQGNDLLGIATWEPSRQHADTLWIAAPPEHEEAVITSLIPHIWLSLHTNRSLLVNYPALKAENAFEQAGLKLLNRLVWMRAILL